MISIRLGGVPEHFNFPIRQALEKANFRDEGIDLTWQIYEGGTGEMTTALSDNTCDACILLTEGIISAILKGNPSKIISGYVSSPLIWGVHTGHSQQTRYENAFKEKIAISRLGSGSHLMPTVDALLKGDEINNDQFVLVNNLEGAISSLNAGETSVFYWEKYTTKPFVQQGLLKRIGEFISPWPCFMIAASDRIIRREPVALDKMLRVIHRACEDFMNDGGAPEMIAKEFRLNEKDAHFWYHATEWATNSWVSDKVLKSVLFTLKEAGIVAETATTDGLVWHR